MTCFGVAAVFFVEDFKYQDGIAVDPVNDSPGEVFIVDAQFVTPCSYRWHRP
jgi:hypothetical protein